jgi:hypothetical protein
MEHKPVETLRVLADVHGGVPHLLSRRERLERWAEVLAREPDRRLRSLGEIEFVPRSERPALRADDSPLTVAYADPVLRASGLESDRLGDAMAFFELSERQAHRLLCSCMNGWRIEAGRAAQSVRRLAEPRSHLNLALGVAGVAACAPMILYWIG